MARSSAVQLDADPRSLQVREGLRGVKPLTDKDRADIRKTIDEKILGDGRLPSARPRSSPERWTDRARRTRARGYEAAGELRARRGGGRPGARDAARDPERVGDQALSGDDGRAQGARHHRSRSRRHATVELNSAPALRDERQWHPVPQLVGAPSRRALTSRADNPLDYPCVCWRDLSAPAFEPATPRSTTVVPDASPDTSTKSFGGDAGDGGDADGPREHPCRSAGGRAVAGSNPVAPTDGSRFAAGFRFLGWLRRRAASRPAQKAAHAVGVPRGPSP